MCNEAQEGAIVTRSLDFDTGSNRDGGYTPFLPTVLTPLQRT